MRTILIEDNARVSAVTAKLLAALGHDVTTFSNGTDALKFFRTGLSYDLILFDFHLGDMTALDVFAAAEIPPTTGAILCTGSGTLEPVVRCFGGKVVGLRKPFRLEELEAAIQQATCRRQSAAHA